MAKNMAKAPPELAPKANKGTLGTTGGVLRVLMVLALVLPLLRVKAVVVLDERRPSLPNQVRRTCLTCGTGR